VFRALGQRLIVVIGLAMLASAQPCVAQEEHKKLWIGSHLVGNEEYAQSISAAVGFQLALMPSELDLNEVLETYVQSHPVEEDTTIKTGPSHLIAHYALQSHQALMVMSGYGVSDPAKTVTAIYVGPKSPEFHVDFARASLLGVATQPAAAQYVNLIFLYAMIKEAKAQNLDYATFISPLREHALSLVYQARAAEPKVVDKINQDLQALVAP
jgi:hypothetical protein